jgi:LmbE family N-acetylglucosaminyl deacetylase
MTAALKLMCVLAHPDDETLGTGGALAKYAAEGVEIYLVTATRGERGWPGSSSDYPGPEALGRIRETELRDAAEVLGVQQVAFLNYYDGKLDQANSLEAITQIVAHLRRVCPQVVLTFDPYGVYGHPDHIAISQYATAAVVAAADSQFAKSQDLPSHRVSKLYYIVETEAALSTYQAAFGELTLSVGGQERLPVAWPRWSITTRVDTSAYREQVWEAISCHRSQMPDIAHLTALSKRLRQTLWVSQTYYRAFSLVNTGKKMEKDLFEGLRKNPDL